MGGSIFVRTWFPDTVEDTNVDLDISQYCPLVVIEIELLQI